LLDSRSGIWSRLESGILKKPETGKEIRINRDREFLDRENQEFLIPVSSRHLQKAGKPGPGPDPIPLSSQDAQPKSRIKVRVKASYL